MAVWENLSDDELYFILKCKKFKHLVQVFNQTISREQWLHDARAHYNAEYDPNIINQSIFSSLNDAPSYSFMTLLAVIGTVSIKIFALSLLTAGFSAAMLMAGIIFFAASYQEQKQTNLKAEKFFDFATIKIRCAEVLIQRHQMKLKGMGINPAAEAPRLENRIILQPFSYRNTNKLQKIKPAIGAGLLTTTMLFGTYYLGLGTIVAAFGATAAATAMLGPIGLGIAFGVAILFGIYCGYKQYQSNVIADKIEKQQNAMALEFDHKQDECEHLYHLIQMHSHLASAADSTHIRSSSAPNLFRRQHTLAPSPNPQEYLIRNQRFHRHKKAPKPGTGDPIIPSLPNINMGNPGLR